MGKPTKEAYQQLQQAYDYFNRSLFAGKLPPCLITMQRKRNVYGYFSGNRWANRDGDISDEIALNPEHFGSGDEEVLSTLVHEMAHLWQHHFGRPGRGRYHNREWAEKMESIGLCPSDSGKPGGKQTGDHVSHYVVDDGPYVKAYNILAQRGFRLSWLDRASHSDSAKPKRTRQKYTCPKCGLNAWAKFEARLICGTCKVALGIG